MVARLVNPSGPPAGGRLGIHGRGRDNERSGGGCAGRLDRVAADGPGTALAVPSGRKPFGNGRRLRSRGPSPWTPSIPDRRVTGRECRAGCVGRDCGGAGWAGPVSLVRGEPFGGCYRHRRGRLLPFGGWGWRAGFVGAGRGRGRAGGARWLFAWDGFRLLRWSSPLRVRARGVGARSRGIMSGHRGRACLAAWGRFGGGVMVSPGSRSAGSGRVFDCRWGEGVSGGGVGDGVRGVVGPGAGLGKAARWFGGVPSSSIGRCGLGRAGGWVGRAAGAEQGIMSGHSGRACRTAWVVWGRRGDGFARFTFPPIGGGRNCYERLSGGGCSRWGGRERCSGFCQRGRRVGEGGATLPEGNSAGRDGAAGAYERVSRACLPNRAGGGLGRAGRGTVVVCAGYGRAPSSSISMVVDCYGSGLAGLGVGQWRGMVL